MMISPPSDSVEGERARAENRRNGEPPVAAHHVKNAPSWAQNAHDGAAVGELETMSVLTGRRAFARLVDAQRTTIEILAVQG